VNLAKSKRKEDMMPATEKPANRTHATLAARSRAEDDARRLERVSASLEAAQKDLTAIGGSLGTGMRDLGRDVNRLLHDARRDLLKMRRAMQRDIERLQRDLTAAATSKPPVKRSAPTRATKPASRRSAAAVH
jgi:hypothetical protein